MHVHLKTLGCRLNEAELESWSRDFRKLGHSITPDVSHADLVVINTCAVTEEAVKKSRKLIRRAQRENPQAKLVMTGCYASLDSEETAAQLGADLLINNDKKSDLVSIVTKELSFPIMPNNAMEPGENSLLKRGRQRAFIKVQDGCRYRCTYCIVTLARGEEHSRSIEEVVNEINELSEQGIKEIVLAGVHLGGYGSDIDTNLVQLITAVLEQTSVPRIRLGSLEPWDLPNNFWSLFENKRLMPHLHLPIQSGSDSVLRRMSRRCKTAEYKQLIIEGRRQVSGLNITTDIIVGFPGETEDEWLETINFVKEIEFGHIHIFAFSPRKGTKAARLDNPIDREIKRQRSEELHQLAKQHQLTALRKMIGTKQPTLVEGNSKEKSDYLSGYTPNYQRIIFPAVTLSSNDIININITDLEDENLIGTSEL